MMVKSVPKMTNAMLASVLAKQIQTPTVPLLLINLVLAVVEVLQSAVSNRCCPVFVILTVLLLNGFYLDIRD